MVLLDDDFASIRAAVEEGRRVYDNLLKALAFALPANLGQGLVMLVAVLCFPFREGHPLLPILPVQILWINLVVAVTLALPLAFEAPEPEIMARPPRRPGAPLLGAFIVGRTVLVAVLMAAAAVGLFLYEYTTTEVLDPNHALRKAQTLAVTGLVLIQACYLLNCRSLTAGFWKMGLFSNPSIYAGLALLLGLQIAMVHVPLFQRLFHTAPLAPRDWLLAAAVGIVVLPVIALEKAWRRRRAS
jgi:Ca2+-transporting ATPase